MWLNLMGAGFVIFFLPGLLFVTARQGLRGQKQWQVMLSSFVFGIGVNAMLFLGAALVETLGHRAIFGWLEAILGYVDLFDGGIRYLLARPYATDAFAALIITYSSSWLAGGLARLFRMGEKDKPFSLQPNSALDVELFKLRKQRTQPILVIRLSTGETIEGKCQIYTFTEPREIMLEVEKDGIKRSRWLKVDDKVMEVEIQIHESEVALKRRAIWLRRFSS